jgi:hypothetical protein
VTERINLELSIANLAELTTGAAGHRRIQLAKYKVTADFIDKLPRTLLARS